MCYSLINYHFIFHGRIYGHSLATFINFLLDFQGIKVISTQSEVSGGDSLKVNKGRVWTGITLRTFSQFITLVHCWLLWGHLFLTPAFSCGQVPSNGPGLHLCPMFCHLPTKFIVNYYRAYPKLWAHDRISDWGAAEVKYLSPAHNWGLIAKTYVL